MPFNKPPSQSISLGSGQISNLQIGGQAGGDLHVSQTNNIANTDSQNITSADVVAALAELKTLISSSTLENSQKNRVVRSIETAQDEVQADNPEKDFIAQNLKRATSVIKDCEEAVDASTSLWEKTKPILEKILPWLRLSMSFFC